MSQRILATVALVSACLLTAACGKRDNAATPPMPQSSPSTTTPSGTASPGMSNDSASAPGMGASH